jgi:glycosyltransferase involved in cell wall biosynthesis
VLESWLAGRPVLVNGLCAATVEHCRRGGGGLWFTSYATFEAALDRLLQDDELRRDLARRGEAYARATFDWAPLLDRYEALCERVLARRSLVSN